MPAFFYYRLLFFSFVAFVSFMDLEGVRGEYYEK